MSAATKQVPTVGVPSAPRIPDDLEALLRRLRLAQVRRRGREVTATTKVRRWEAAEVLEAVLPEDVAGKDRSAWRPGVPPCARPAASRSA